MSNAILNIFGKDLGQFTNGIFYITHVGVIAIRIPGIGKTLLMYSDSCEPQKAIVTTLPINQPISIDVETVVDSAEISGTLHRLHDDVEFKFYGRAVSSEHAFTLLKICCYMINSGPDTLQRIIYFGNLIFDAYYFNGFDVPCMSVRTNLYPSAWRDVDYVRQQWMALIDTLTVANYYLHNVNFHKELASLF